MSPPDTPPESHHTWTPVPEPMDEVGSDSLGTWAPDLRPPVSPNTPTVPPGPPPSRPEEPEEVEVERYTDQGLLGRGGIAEVRSVHDARLGREVAVKRLRRLGSRVGRRRFLREARITAQLEHPGIVPVYDASVGDDGVPYYTMKYVRGTALSQALREAPDLHARLGLIPPFTAVCQAMAYAHDRRVIHRDLKPDNIMLGEFGEALVVDWGLARALDEDDEVTAEVGADVAASLVTQLTDSLTAPRPIDIDHAALTVQGQVSGTPAYMAPEQAKGQRTAPATDVYALGAILYEILTGQPPHGIHPDVQAQLARARTGQIQPVRARAPEAPAELAAIAERALAADPADRYPTAAELAHELERWRTGRLVQAYTYTPIEHVRRLARQYALPLGLAAAGIAGIFVVGGIGLWNTRAERDRARASEAVALENERRAVEATRRAERDLATLLAGRADIAARDGIHGAARAYAAASVALHDTPRARGTLGEAWAREGIAFEQAVLAPHECLAIDVLPDGDMVCAGRGQVSRFGWTGPARWTTPVTGDALRVQVADGTAWVATDEGLTALALDGTVRGTQLDGLVSALLPQPNGGVRFSQNTPTHRQLVDWVPGSPPEVTPYGHSLITEFTRHDGRELRLHAAGYISDPLSTNRDGIVREVDHVGYDMLRIGAAWWVVGTRTTILHDDGRVTEPPGLSGALGVAEANAHGQLVAMASNHDAVVYDATSGQILARLPAPEAQRPALALRGDTLITGHEALVRRWRVPTRVMTPSLDVDWRMVRERDDGLRRLYCGHQGVAELHRLDTHEVVPLQSDVDGGSLMRCHFVDGQPEVVWSRTVVRWTDEGTVVSSWDAPTPIADLTWLGDKRVFADRQTIVTFDGQRLGDGVIEARHEPSDTLVVQDLAAEELVWWRATTADAPLERVHVISMSDDQRALAVLPDRRVVVGGASAAHDAPPRLLGGATPHPLPAHPTRVIAAMAIDDRHVVTGDLAGTLRLWDLDDNRLVAVVDAHDARVAQIHLTGVGEGRRIVSTSFDASVHTWALAPLFHPADEVVARAQARDHLRVEGGEVGFLPVHDEAASAP